jgi:membrane-bound ClpP family serine protease
MAGFVAFIGVVLGAIVGVWGFQNMASDIQVIIALVGSFAAIICLSLVFVSISLSFLNDKIRRLGKQTAPRSNQNSKDTMADALKDFTHSIGGNDTTDAIRHLATEQLKYLGYLKR